ncbi:hypothetical protein RUND412_005819 [Rhizina undulata]
MSAVVAELENALQAMQAGKPPGVSGSKIQQITELSLAHVQSESVIIQKVYTHFKKCPGTHKLGPLYVVDSIARKYLENAKRFNQEISAAAPDGTFGAGVHRITNLLPALMNDILQHAPPEENKDKIEKLVAIWERSSTFSPEVLADIKKKIAASPMFQNQNPVRSTTPIGSPPAHLQSFVGQMVHQPHFQHLQQPQPNVQPVQSSSMNTDSTASILERLAQMAKQNQNITAAPPPPPPLAAVPSIPQYNVSNPQTNAYTGIPTTTAGTIGSSQPAVSMPQVSSMPLPFTSTPPNANTALSTLSSQVNGAYPVQNSNPVQVPQFGAQMPAQQGPQQTGLPNLESVALLQFLLQNSALQGFSMPQLGQAFEAIGASGPNGPGTTLGGAIPAWQQMMNAANAQVPPPQDPSRDRYDSGLQRNHEHYSPPPRSHSPPRYGTGHRHGRSRSRSPARFGRTHSPPAFRRRSPVYGEYEGNDNRGGRDGERNRGGRGRGGGYGRRNSPRNRRDRSRTPPGRFANGRGSQGGDARSDPALPPVPKYLEYDQTIGPGNIKVLSRTLFVGGVTITEDELRKLFEEYGRVQSCIVNSEKRHAFIKMLTRGDAVKAKNGMETYRAENMTLRTRWGVGFGPRDCSDYQTGISIIPIDRLTDADQRWMVSAEYGGTGGKPLAGEMCVEEPDIEIGQGVSSKAISKRFPTDSGGAKGPRSSHDSDRLHRGKRNDYNDSKQQQQQQRGPNRDSIGVAPPTPGFGAGFPFPLPMMPSNNMPQGFQYPGFPGQPSNR